ncbi:hypothetical protein BC936DRAFT_147103, partial [Jimgerdemannia flammicorona]
MQSWTRRYFFIDGEQLMYAMRGKTSKEDDQPNTINLRVCTIKPADTYDRRYTFEIISPMRILVLQAENDIEMADWIQCLRNANQAALNSDKLPSPRGLSDNKDVRRYAEGSHHSENDRHLLKLVREMAGNDECADCQAAVTFSPAINLVLSVSMIILFLARTIYLHAQVYYLRGFKPYSRSSMGKHKHWHYIVHRMLRYPSQFRCACKQGQVIDFGQMGTGIYRGMSIHRYRWVMLRLGNTRSNSIFEGRVQAGEVTNTINSESSRLVHYPSQRTV